MNWLVPKGFISFLDMIAAIVRRKHGADSYAGMEVYEDSDTGELHHVFMNDPVAVSAHSDDAVRILLKALSCGELEPETKDGLVPARVYWETPGGEKTLFSGMIEGGGAQQDGKACFVRAADFDAWLKKHTGAPAAPPAPALHVVAPPAAAANGGGPQPMKKDRGMPPVKRMAAEASMRDAIDAEQITPDQLFRMAEKDLIKTYGGGAQRTTCREARKAVLADNVGDFKSGK